MGKINIKNKKQYIMKQETINPPPLIASMNAEDLATGYFRFVGKVAGNWKYAEFVNPSGVVEVVSSSTMKHTALFTYVQEWKCGRIKAPVIVIDQTYVTPEYYRIKGSHKQFYFEKIVN
jgi:hypothetical protein